MSKDTQGERQILMGKKEEEGFRMFKNLHDEIQGEKILRKRPDVTRGR